MGTHLGPGRGGGGAMIEVVLNDRLGKKVRVKCNEDDTVGDLKKLVAAQTGTRRTRSEFRSGTRSIRTTSRWRTTRSTTGWASSCTTTKNIITAAAEVAHAHTHPRLYNRIDHACTSFRSRGRPGGSVGAAR